MALIFCPPSSAIKSPGGSLRSSHVAVIDKTARLNPKYQKVKRTQTRLIIIHTSEATLESTLRTVSEGKRIPGKKEYTDGGHAHYVIARNGKIFYTLNHRYIANHAGYSMWNGEMDVSGISIGIEMVGYSAGKLTDAQYKSVSDLIDMLQRIYDLDDLAVLTHAQVAYAPPNFWFRHNHRGRKLCAINFDRKKAGLKNAHKYDPDVVAGRLLPHRKLSKIFYSWEDASHEKKYRQTATATDNVKEKSNGKESARTTRAVGKKPATDPVKRKTLDRLYRKPSKNRTGQVTTAASQGASTGAPRAKTPGVVKKKPSREKNAGNKDKKTIAENIPTSPKEENKSARFGQFIARVFNNSPGRGYDKAITDLKRESGAKKDLGAKKEGRAEKTTAPPPSPTEDAPDRATKKSTNTPPKIKGQLAAKTVNNNPNPAQIQPKTPAPTIQRAEKKKSQQAPKASAGQPKPKASDALRKKSKGNNAKLIALASVQGPSAGDATRKTTRKAKKNPAGNPPPTASKTAKKGPRPGKLHIRVREEDQKKETGKSVQPPSKAARNRPGSNPQKATAADVVNKKSNGGKTGHVAIAPVQPPLSGAPRATASSDGNRKAMEAKTQPAARAKRKTTVAHGQTATATDNVKEKSNGKESARTTRAAGKKTATDSVKRKTLDRLYRKPSKSRTGQVTIAAIQRPINESSQSRASSVERKRSSGKKPKETAKATPPAPRPKQSQPQAFTGKTAYDVSKKSKQVAKAKIYQQLAEKKFTDGARLIEEGHHIKRKAETLSRKIESIKDLLDLVEDLES